MRATAGRRSARDLHGFRFIAARQQRSHVVAALGAAQRVGRALRPGPHWQLSAQHDDGDALNAAVHEMELEGLMAKRLDSQYLPGKRTTAWRKVKRRIEQTSWSVAGPKAKADAGVASADYSSVATVTASCRYAGRCRVGSSRTTRSVCCSRTFADLRRDTSPFAVGSVPRTEARAAHWVEPRVSSSPWPSPSGPTKDRVRHPAYQGRLPGVDPLTVTLP